MARCSSERVAAFGVILLAAMVLGVPASGVAPAAARDPLWTQLPWDARMGPSWFRERAERGDAESMYRLGLLHENGVGVDRDPATARDWYQRAAEHGHARAQYRLARAWHTGRGGPVSLTRAAKWYDAAADKPIARAAYHLGVLTLRGVRGEPDPSAAAEHFREAANAGIAEAWLSLGYLHATGNGVARDRVRALAMLIRAAESDVPGAADARDSLLGELNPAQIRTAKRRARHHGGP
jgi:TPR repeat protein